MASAMATFTFSFPFRNSIIIDESRKSFKSMQPGREVSARQDDNVIDSREIFAAARRAHEKEGA